MPHKLVQRIVSGQFVDLKELLPDNMALQQQMESVQGHLPLTCLPPHLKPRLREISSPVSWAICFLTYVAVRTQDHTTRSHLAYGRLLLQEALRHGGSGWLEYDRLFRKQVAINPTLPWDSLQPALHSTLILGQRRGTGSFCTLCAGTDHSAAQCALAPLQPQPSTQPFPRQPDNAPQRRPETLLRICVSWNKGSCSYPATCSYRHICATCRENHMAKDCALNPEDSEYKRPQRPTRPPRSAVMSAAGSSR